MKAIASALPISILLIGCSVPEGNRVVHAPSPASVNPTIEYLKKTEVQEPQYDLSKLVVMTDGSH